ncbi:hypothetical protein HK405_005716, partial [Cladochytrium tenue]
MYPRRSLEARPRKYALSSFQGWVATSGRLKSKPPASRNIYRIVTALVGLVLFASLAAAAASAQTYVTDVRARGPTIRRSVPVVFRRSPVPVDDNTKINLDDVKKINDPVGLHLQGNSNNALVKYNGSPSEQVQAKVNEYASSQQQPPPQQQQPPPPQQQQQSTSPSTQAGGGAARQSAFQVARGAIGRGLSAAHGAAKGVAKAASTSMGLHAVGTGTYVDENGVTQ